MVNKGIPYLLIAGRTMQIIKEEVLYATLCANYGNKTKTAKDLDMSIRWVRDMVRTNNRFKRFRR